MLRNVFFSWFFFSKNLLSHITNILMRSYVHIHNFIISKYVLGLGKERVRTEKTNRAYTVIYFPIEHKVLWFVHCLSFSFYLCHSLEQICWSEAMRKWHNWRKTHSEKVVGRNQTKRYPFKWNKNVCVACCVIYSKALRFYLTHTVSSFNWQHWAHSFRRKKPNQHAFKIFNLISIF